MKNWGFAGAGLFILSVGCAGERAPNFSAKVNLPLAHNYIFKIHICLNTSVLKIESYLRLLDLPKGRVEQEIRNQDRKPRKIKAIS